MCNATALTIAAVAGAVFTGGSSLGLLGAEGVGAGAAGAAGAASAAGAAGAAGAGLTAFQTAALGASAAGAGLTAYGAYSSAQTQKKVAANNAAIADIQAQDAQNRGELNAQKSERQGSQVTGAQRATYAARGLDLGVGTPSDVIDQTNFFAESDAATARTNANKEAWALKSQAGNFQAQSDAINPGLQLTGSLLGGASSVASKWYDYSRPRP